MYIYTLTGSQVQTITSHLEKIQKSCAVIDAILTSVPMANIDDNPHDKSTGMVMPMDNEGPMVRKPY